MKPKHGASFFIFITMKFVRNIILALALLLPSVSMAEEEFSLYPYPIDFSIGGGPRLFSTSLEFVLGSCATLYETPKSDSSQDFFEPKHALTWTNRIRMMSDYDNHPYGFLFQPSIRYMFKLIAFTAVVGPEIGWETETGFEYGMSARVGGVPGLFLTNYEVGYLINYQRFYFTVVLDMFSLLMLLSGA